MLGSKSNSEENLNLKSKMKKQEFVTSVQIVKPDFNGLYLYTHIILIHLISLLAKEHSIQSHVISRSLLHWYSCLPFMLLRPNIACISNSHCAYGFVCFKKYYEHYAKSVVLYWKFKENKYCVQMAVFLNAEFAYSAYSVFAHFYLLSLI